MRPPTPLRRVAALLVASFTAFPAACSDDDAFLPGETVTIALVTPTWSATAPEEDPFAPLVGRVSNRCTAWQPAVEGSILEFSTRACDAMTVEAPLGIDLPAGTRIHLATTHAILTAEAPSTGWIGLAIGDQVLVARDVPIPGPASAYADTAVLPCAASATQPLRLHVSNHGPNSWRFVTLQATLPR